MKKQIIIIICVILGATAIFGFRSGYNVQNIVNVIKAECNCQEVSPNDSLHGLTFSKQTGMNLGDTYTITLQNCKFDNFEKDIERLTNRLTKRIPNFCEDEVLILNFDDKNPHAQEVIIKDCKWIAK